jgi:hypothetical protein
MNGGRLRAPDPAETPACHGRKDPTPMFRAFLIAAGLMLALGALSPADAARSRARAAAAGTEATAASAEAPRASSTRRTRRTEARQQRRSRSEATTQRRNRGEATANRQRRGGQHASASGSRRAARGVAPAAPATTQ